MIVSGSSWARASSIQPTKYPSAQAVRVTDSSEGSPPREKDPSEAVVVLFSVAFWRTTAPAIGPLSLKTKPWTISGARVEVISVVGVSILAVGDAEFQRKCLGKMSDVADEGRTVLFVSHNMSAIQRLTEETIVLDKGRVALRAPTPEAVDYYMTSEMSHSGEHQWNANVTGDGNPFKPKALRVLDHQGRVVDQVPSTESFSIEFEYELEEAITGLRVGLYLYTSRGEPVFTSFDTDNPERYERWVERNKAKHVSRCRIPANFLNGGTFVLGVNASTFQIRSFFTDEHALTFTVDPTGAPGTQWAEPRRGPVRPALEWEVAEAVQ